MSNITTRASNGAPLTHAQMDDNLTSLNATKVEVSVVDALATELEQTNAQVQGIDARVSATETVLVDLTDKVERDKGYFATPAALEAAYPVAVDGDYARVDSTGTVWIYDDGVWKDTDTKGQVESVNGQAGAVTLSADDIPYAPSAPLTATNTQDAIEQARSLANARWLDDLPVALAGAADGCFLKVTGTPGNEQVVALQQDVAAASEHYEFPDSGTFVVPPRAKRLRIQVIGGGGGGASGSSVTGHGGAGGAGGGYTVLTVEASALGSSFAVIVGARGFGGVATAAGDHVAGTSGGSSHAVIPGSGLSASGGAGATGQAAVGTTGLPGGTAAAAPSGSGSTGGFGGSSNYLPATAMAGGSGGGGGGAAGGGGTAGGGSRSGGLGQISSSAGAAGGAGLGGDANQSALSNYPTFTACGGDGGGGGQAGGGKGGRGPGYGSGGGGGGGCGPGNTPGDGGDGQPGIVIIDVEF